MYGNFRFGQSVHVHEHVLDAFLLFRNGRFHAKLIQPGFIVNIFNLCEQSFACNYNPNAFTISDHIFYKYI